MKRKTIFLLAILLLAFVHSNSQTKADAARETNETELRRQSFEKVWSTINENHYDKTFGGTDWRKVREIYEPRAMSAKTRAEFHAVLSQMLGELKLSHFGVYGRETQIETSRNGSGTIGIELKMIDGRAVVSRVRQSSTAEKAGLKPGFVVEKIDGKSVSEILEPFEKNFAALRYNEQTKRIYRERILLGFIEGKPETIVRIEVLNGKNQPQIFSVARYAAKVEMSEAVGNFPPQEIVFEAKRLESGVGYIRFNGWLIPQMPKIRAAVSEFADAPGIVFDLRGNPGGLGGMATGVAGLLMTEQVSLGSMTGRETELKFIVYPQANPFSGKVVILTDYGTASTSEIFAAGLQEIGRARVVGERSAGAVLPSVFVVLPTDAIFQYAVSDYKSPKNVLIEGIGVTPDTEVKQTREALLAGRDLPLEEAVRQILN
jgi:Periplasmic protease